MLDATVRAEVDGKWLEIARYEAMLRRDNEGRLRLEQQKSLSGFQEDDPAEIVVLDLEAPELRAEVIRECHIVDALDGIAVPDSATPRLVWLRRSGRAWTRPTVLVPSDEVGLDDLGALAR